MFHAVAKSRRDFAARRTQSGGRVRVPVRLKPQAGQECSRTHNGLSVETPHDAHSLVDLDAVDTLLYELPRARSIGHITNSKGGVIGITTTTPSGSRSPRKSKTH
jgi:hypothetical protein